jgi:hypothetical protein
MFLNIHVDRHIDWSIHAHSIPDEKAFYSYSGTFCYFCKLLLVIYD